jgi:amino acid adenylation domain-containing protein/non-ribosomal peptide synthase protein (TIGR01720 family)
LLNDTKKEYYLLSHPQKRIWYIEQIYPDTPLHNIGGSIHIKGTIDFNLLEVAVNYFIKRHNGLRLQLCLQNGEVKQFVASYQPVKLELVDFSRLPEPERKFETWVEHESQRNFVLYDNPLFQFVLFRVAARDNGYWIKFHHLIADGWSINIMTEEICDTYEKLKRGQPLSEQSAPSYLEYLEAERQYLGSERFVKDQGFWNEKFRAIPEHLSVAKDNTLSGRRKTYDWDQDRTAGVKLFCNHYKISLNTFFIVVFLIYRLKTTQSTDIVLGIPVLNRAGRRQKQMVGMFTSSMPFRYTDTQWGDIDQFIRQVNQELSTCYFHQRYPYNLLTHDLELKKQGLDYLYDVCINYYNTRLNTELDGLRIENKEFYNGNQFYSLQLVIKEWLGEEKLTLNFDYRLSCYSEILIEKLNQCLNLIIDQLLAFPHIEIAQIQILAAQERQRLLFDFNNTAAFYPGDKTIHQLFEAQVEKTPDKTAISFGNRVMTYGELNQRSNQLAHYLKEKGVSCESIVGFMTTHSPETIIGILGILKAGGAYLPIDPSGPPARISYVLKDAGTKILVTNAYQDQVNQIKFGGQIMYLHDPEIYLEDGSNPPQVCQPENLAYLIYTSGSTGKPKGVMVEHRGLVNYIWWANKVYMTGQDEVFALYSSLAFDLTVTSIFTALISGHRIHITEDDGTGFILDKILRERQATIVKLTPAHLALLQDRNYKNSSVRCLIVGGEDLKTSLAAKIQQNFGERLSIFNEYGPTETVVGCMIHRYDRVKDQRNSVPIGKPADNVQIYLLDQYLNPVVPGAAGELYIAGDGVARGYLNQPGLTEKYFVENPFRQGKKMYRTGDLASFLDDGAMEYRGRVDYQVKIHGHRIELGEIEATLIKHPDIKAVVVIDRNDTDRGQYLCAYYVGQVDLTVPELRDYLTGFLPEYMIPLTFMRLTELPLTGNGKVYRSLLPEPCFEEIKEVDEPVFRTEKELILAEIIAEVLNMEQVRATDNFFQIGGDSIKAIQISAKLKKQAFRIRVRDILTHPVISEMAAKLEADTAVVTNEPSEGWIEPTPISNWFFSRNFKNMHHWNQSVLLRLAPHVDVSILDTVLSTLVKYHDSLRINYSFETKKLYYNPAYLTQVFACEVIDLRAYAGAEQEKRINSAGTELKSGLNLENGLLFKAALFHCGANDYRLLLTAHHLIIDAVSWRIILDDLACLMNQALQNQALELPPKTFSYQKWAMELNNYNPTIEARHYWETVVITDFQFPVDYDRGEDYLQYCRRITVTLPVAETEILTTASHFAYHTKPHELLIIALALTLRDWVGKNTILLELEGHGREEIFEGIDISRTVGWFTSIYPVWLRINGADLSSQIKFLKDQLRNIPGRGGDFGVLKYLHGAFSGPEQKLIRFNYLGDLGNSFQLGLFNLASEASGLESDNCNSLTALLEINAMIVNQSLQFNLTYSQNKFAAATVKKFGDSYLNRLRTILNHCQTKGQSEFTPADFDTAALSQADLDLIFT